MSSVLARLEKTMFRSLNAFVEPAVRKGLGSPSLSPASLIVLETIGFKSGELRRTPLWSVGIGPYRLVSTARGKRSFWVRNLQQQPSTSFYLGGKRRKSQAIVIDAGTAESILAGNSNGLPPCTAGLAALLAKRVQHGWVFAILVPVPPTR